MAPRVGYLAHPSGNMAGVGAQSTGYFIRAPTGDAFAEYHSNPDLGSWSRGALMVAAKAARDQANVRLGFVLWQRCA